MGIRKDGLACVGDLSMSAISTSDFAGTAGSAWPTLSNGAAWVFNNEGNAFVSAPSRTVDGSNHGNTVATPNATASNKSIERAQAGTDTASDPLVTVVIKNNNAGSVAGWNGAGAVAAGIMLRRVAATATYYMVTVGKAKDGSSNLYYGLQIGKVSPAGTYTTLKAVSTLTPSMTDLLTFSNRFVMSAKITVTASGILIAARTWTGTSTGSPTVGWSTNPSNVYSSSSYYSTSYEDTSPLTGTLNGLWVWRQGAGGSSTVEFSDFSYSSQAPLVVDPAGGIASAESVPGTAKLPQALIVALLRVGGLASGEAWGGPLRINQIIGKKPGGIVSQETWGGPRRFDQTARIGSISTSEAFGNVLLASVIQRLGEIGSAEQVAGITAIINQGIQKVYPGSISTGEAFGSFTIYRVGGTVYAAHSVTGVVVASAPTIQGLVSAVESLTGVTASTHFIEP
jgi:hypothetical protein